LNFLSLSGAFAGTPASADAKKLNLTVTASDAYGASASTPVQIQVLYGPTLNQPISNQVAQIGILFSFTIPAETFLDRDGDPLAYSATNNGLPLPQWMQFRNGTFIATPQSSDAGKLQLVITANAPNGLRANAGAQIAVVYGPSFNRPIGAQIAKIGSLFSYTFPGDTFIDQDGDKLEILATNNGLPLPAWLQFRREERTFTGTPQGTDAGLVDATTMHEFDAMCTPVESLSPREIKSLRLREKMSQNVFALYLNTSVSTVQQWERGQKHPRGISLKMLNLIAKKGIHAIA